MTQTGTSPDLVSGVAITFWQTTATPMTGTGTVWKNGSFPAQPGMRMTH